MKEWQINCQSKLNPERKLVTQYNSCTNDHSREQSGKIDRDIKQPAQDDKATKSVGIRRPQSPASLCHNTLASLWNSWL